MSGLKLSCLIVVAILFLSYCNITGQQNLQISGYVLDAETGKPVPYATVGVVQQQVGISANLNGYFNLRVKQQDPSHDLLISSIGYNKKLVPLSEVNWGEEMRITLEPRLTLLQEVVISGKKRTIEDLVTNTSKKRKIFLRSSPYLMNGLYRETFALNDQYLGFTEAQGLFYISGYNPRYKNNQGQIMTYDLVQWKHIRRNHYPDTSYMRIGKMLKAKDYYLHDGPLHKKNVDKFIFSAQDSSQYDDQLVVVIEFKPKAAYRHQISYSGRMIIKEDDQALLKLEIDQKGAEPFLSQKLQNQQQSNFSISFFLFNGQYYLNRCTFRQSYQSDRGNQQYTMEIISGQFTQQTPQFLNNAQRAVLYSEMLNPKVHYDPEFWSTFKFAESDVYREVSKDRTRLEEEFMNNDNLRLVPLPEGMESYEQMVNEQNMLDFFLQY